MQRIMMSGNGFELLEARRVLAANVAAPLAAPLIEKVATEIVAPPTTGDSAAALTSVGDFDSDGQLTDHDIDMLCADMRTPTGGTKFDITGDGIVDTADMDMLVLDLMDTKYGDADLDGVVSTADAMLLFNHMFQADTGWASGDFQCDGVTDGADFVTWLQSFHAIDRNVTEPDDTGTDTTTGDETETVVAAPPAVTLQDRETDDEDESVDPADQNPSPTDDPAGIDPIV